MEHPHHQDDRNGDRQASCSAWRPASQGAERFGRITRLAAGLFRMPIAFILAYDHQAGARAVALYGLDPADLSDTSALRQRAEACGEQPMVVADALHDEGLRHHPLVCGEHKVRLCIARTLLSDDGRAIGMLGIMDRAPALPDREDLERLHDLARLAEEEIAREEAAVQRIPLPANCPECTVQRRVADLAVDNERLFREIRQRRQVEKTFRTIVDSLPAFIAQVDDNARLTFLNRRAARYLGKQPAELIGQHLRDVFGEDYYTRHKGDLDAALAGSQTVFEDEFVVRGKRLHYHSICVPDKDLAGRVTGAYAMVFDITERKNSELLQAESEERLRTITDNLPVLISYIDREERYRFANATYEHWFGTPVDSIVGSHASAVLGPEVYARRRQYIRRALDGESIRFEMESPVRGESRIVESLFIPHVRNGVVEGIYTLSTDITPVKAAEQRLRMLARLDPLTELPNRRGFDEKLQEAALRASRTGQPIALMFLDVDFFKQINDTHGHNTGDEVLREFARRLKSSVRAVDTVSRIAGDEFTVILEGVRNRAEAAGIAQKILASVQQPFLVDGSPLEVTTSIGIACMGEPDGEVPDLYTRADQALYQAKAAGRNRYVVAENGSGKTGQAS